MYSLYFHDADQLQDATVFAQALSRMSYARRDKVLAYRFPKDQRLSLAAGLLLDDWLHTLEHSLQSLTIAENEFGKPYFPALPDWHFSLSHAGQYAVLAVSNHPIGVDMEQIHDMRINVAERYFTADEQRQIRESDDPNAQFFRIWTCKEAYVKAVGIGLQLGLQSFSVDLEKSQLSAPSDATNFRFSQPEAPTGYALSVCIAHA